MNFFEKWTEIDLNPIISFSSSSKIIYSNTQAQYLLSKITPKELFNIAVKYASKTYGEKTTYIGLKLKNYSFYAVTVIYQNDEEIHLKLYKSASINEQKKLTLSNSDKTNIFTLVDLVISTSKIKTNINYLKEYDPSIPEFRIDKSLFIKSFSEVLNLFTNCDEVKCMIKFKIGEYIKVEEKKYSIILIEVSSKDILIEDTINIKEQNSFIISYETNKVMIDLPLIF